DVRDATSELFWYTEAELKEVKADKKKPVIVRTIASVILKAFAKGDFRYIKELVEQVLGKPQQKIDQKNTHVSNSVEIVSWLRSDVRDATSELFWYTEAELKEVKADKKKPVIVRTIASVILKAFAKGDFRYIKELVEQVLGKPQQKIDQKNTHVSNSVEIVSWL